MATFAYSGFDRHGRLTRGLLDVSGPKEARERLAARGILAHQVVPWRGRIRLSPAVRAWIYHDLSVLLRSGSPLMQALDVLLAGPLRPPMRVFLGRLRSAIAEGKSLAEELPHACPSVSVFEQALLQSGERSGTLDQALERASAFLDQQVRIRSSLVTAAIYPICVLVLGAISAGVMLGILLPMVIRSLDIHGQALPTLTRTLMRIGTWAMWGGGLWIVAPAAAIVGFLYRLRRHIPTRQRWEMVLFRSPVLGRAYSLLSCSRFAGTLETLLRGGVPVVEALPLAARATGSTWIASLCEREAESLRHGERLSDAILRLPPLASRLAAWIRTGEESGNLASVLHHAAERYHEQWARYLARLVAVVPLILILLVGGVVLLLAAAILLPVLSLTEGLRVP